MAKTIFENNILYLKFSFLAEAESGGVLLTKTYEGINTKIASPDILFGLEKAIKFEADAVYFRYFKDGRSAIPQLYFFDFTNKILSREDKNNIHIRMWNGYQVPAYVIVEKSAVSFFDAREKPETNKAEYASQILTLTGEAIKTFNAQGFDDGLFWEEQNAKTHFKFEQSATRDLIRGLKEVYKSFKEKSNLDRHVVLKLLVQCLLIKYLEERDEASASGYFAGTYFKKNFQCNDFCDTVRNGKLLDLLDRLASDFNGKIFEWDKKVEKKERAGIQATAVNRLADYLDGKIQDNQYVLWRLYSFSYLPVEVISSVYEELLADSKDIVYTPEMIVCTMVDECMPLKNPQANFSLIDVSCGSGIFLVKAYKRIVQWWRYEQWQKTGKLLKPSLAVLKELLLKSIYGIDIQQDAIRLSVFSLALAVLDEVNLDPPTWGKLKFPDLSENIITEDFFKFITTKPLGEFHLVIGNPPFNLQPVNGKEPGRKQYFELLKKETGYQSEIRIPDENPALHFLVQSMKLLTAEGLLCLIQPSGPLFYQNNAAFKQEVFSKYNLLQVIDLTKLADKLWGKTNVSTAVVFLRNGKPDSSEILHLIANNTFSNSNRLFLEFDHYDFHYVSQEASLNNQYVWKSNLLGGGRITQLVERLEKLRTLGQFLKEKVHYADWKYSEGYTIGNKKNYADFIHNKVSVRPELFGEQGVIKTVVEREGFFEAPRTFSKEIYKKPHILIKENVGNEFIPMDFLDYDAVFSHEIIGIYAPPKESKELREVYRIIKENNRLYRFYIFATSSRILVGRATAILKKDIDNLPFPEGPDSIKISHSENLIIDELLSYQIRKTNLQLFEYASINSILEFSVIFCKTLNSIYESNGKSFQLYKILDAGRYYALHFEYTKKQVNPSTEKNGNLENYIQDIIPTQKRGKQKGHIQKIMKAYGKDKLILVKPKQLCYWLPSIALRDADESFADYVKARYHNA